MKNYEAKRRLDQTRMMIVKGGRAGFSTIEDLPRWLGAEDLLVMNSSGTVPGSFIFAGFELRLAAFAGGSLSEIGEWWAVSFAAGSWRQATEERTHAPILREGLELPIGPGFKLTIVSVHPSSPRLLRVRFSGARVVDSIFTYGKPIQYSYHRDPLAIWDIQTPLSQIPISVEAPSSLFPFSWSHLLKLRAKTAYVLHGAGLSSTGDSRLDTLLPLPEYYEVPEQTWDAITRAKSRGGKIVAIGTSSARALESAAGGDLSGTTDLRLSADRPARVIDALLTGVHEPGTSHFTLEESLRPAAQLHDAFREASARGLIGHEYGDVALIWK